MPFIYQARDLNRIPNAFYIAGNGLPRESFQSTSTYQYRISGPDWSPLISSSNSDTITSGISLINSFDGTDYNLTRIGIQFATAILGIVPIGMSISFSFDNGIGLPFKIRAFKGTTDLLTGEASEFAIPLNEGLIPYSPEVEINAEGGWDLFFYQNAIDDFLADHNQSIFVLGEYDYNNIEPKTNHQILNSLGGDFTLTGQT